jgi:hypothetical protein
VENGKIETLQHPFYDFIDRDCLQAVCQSKYVKREPR